VKRLNILFLIDQWGWAYCFNAREQAKYSCHNITRKLLTETTVDDLKNIDIVYIHGPNIWKDKSDELIPQIRKHYPDIKIVGCYSVEIDLMYPDCDLVVCISSNFYHKLCKMYEKRNCPVIFLPKGIDSEFFIPDTLPKTFKVGWAGRVADVKRTYLLDKLKFYIERHKHHGNKFFYKDRDRTPMKNFYNSLSCLVLTSESEALPRTVLEAMSCGRVIVSTKVGSLPLLLHKEFLVDVYPEEKTIAQMNKILFMLSRNREICEKEAQRNRDFIVNNWSWKKLQPYWDMMFTELVENHIVSLKIYDKKYRESLKQKDLL
jgi:glycosyltransferase involved in cell wall biosynthesis